MHETGLARQLLPQIQKIAAEKGLNRVKKIKLEIGEGLGVEEDLLVHSLKDHLLPGTVAEGAEIEIKWMPVGLLCENCGKIYTDFVEKCPVCGGTLKLSGRQLRVVDCL